MDNYKLIRTIVSGLAGIHMDDLSGLETALYKTMRDQGYLTLDEDRDIKLTPLGEDLFS